MPANFLFSALTAGASTVAAALGVRIATYCRYFGYHVARDQAYDFSESEATIVPVELSRDGFVWPEATGAWDTGLLELRVRSTAGGHFADPFIEVRSRHHYERQYLERGARGMRHVNLGTFVADDPAPRQRVWLHGENLRWSEGSARLILFQTPLPPSPRVLVLAPHPDDAELAAFGLYSSTDAWVVTVTAGERGLFYSAGDRMPERQRQLLTGRMRVWDSLTVPEFGNVPAERAMNLCYPDSALEEMFAAPESPPASAALHHDVMQQFRSMNVSPLVGRAEPALTWHALVSDLHTILDAVKPNVIAAPHPLLDDHPDHAYSTLALCEALDRSPAASGQLLLYVVHSRESSMYPFGGSDGTVPPPPHFGAPAGFRTLHSRVLPRETARWKLPALEAMHDLRSMPAWQPPSWREILRDMLGEVRGKITSLGRDPNNLFRRAVRPNEFFFALPYSDAPELRTETLRAIRAGELPWHRFQ